MPQFAMLRITPRWERMIWPVERTSLCFGERVRFGERMRGKGDSWKGGGEMGRIGRTLSRRLLVLDGPGGLVSMAVYV